MSGVMIFESKYGEIAVEVEDEVAREALTQEGMLRGYEPVSTGGGVEEAIKAPQRFEDAMQSLKVYAASINDLVASLDLMPKEISVQVGLKLKGTVGFIIAKTGAESDIKVSLKWEPKRADPAA